MNKFVVDFVLLVRRLTPSFLFLEPLPSWFKALLKPLETINSNLWAFVQAVRKTVSYNSQTAIFETYLNDTFDETSRRIYIENTFTFAERFFIFYKSENQTADITYFKSENGANTYIFDNSEFVANADFLVYVPNTLVFDQNKMVEIIKLTKLAGKRFQIILF